MPRPDITFFCELGPTALAKLFDKPGLIDELQVRQYSISLGILDFSDERASVVRRLNERGVRVVAWLLLPLDQGYWFNLGNYPQAIARYQAFKHWADREQIVFGAVGLDIEPLLSDREAARRGRLLHMFRRAAQAHRNALYPAAREAYLDLTAYIRHDGYEVHTYQYPLIVDDRRAGTSLVQRSLDIVEVPADLEVLMLYSSHVKMLLGTDLKGAFVDSYAQHADAIAIGVSGGGFLDPSSSTASPRMTLQAFRRDLRIAAQHTDEIHIFSLEGCVERGWLKELEALDWDAPVPIARRHRLQMGAVRAALGLVLWSSRFGWTALGWLGWLVAGGLLVQRRLRWWRRRQSRRKD